MTIRVTLPVITQETASLIWAAHREIAAGEKLLADMAERLKYEHDKRAPTLKDAFGRVQHLQLGIPCGENGHTLYQVSPVLAESVIRAHIENSRTKLIEACERAFIELGAKPRFDLVIHLARQIAFSSNTFGPGARTSGVCDHIRKELLEVEESGGSLEEWVDVVILALDGAWRSGATPQQIADAIESKQTKNEGRKWPDWRTADPTKAIEHDRTGETA